MIKYDCVLDTQNCFEYINEYCSKCYLDYILNDTTHLCEHFKLIMPKCEIWDNNSNHCLICVDYYTLDNLLNCVHFLVVNPNCEVWDSNSDECSTCITETKKNSFGICIDDIENCVTIIQGICVEC